MTSHRRSRPVFDRLTAALKLQFEVVSNARVAEAVTAAHEAGHAAVADLFGCVEDVFLFGDEGEMFHTLAPRIVCSDDVRADRARENGLVALAGPAAETLTFGRRALAGTGSSDDILAVWRSLARHLRDESLREARIVHLFIEAQQILVSRWPSVASLAGHLLEQKMLRVGQAQRVLHGAEPDRSLVFYDALKGIT